MRDRCLRLRQEGPDWIGSWRLQTPKGRIGRTTTSKVICPSTMTVEEALDLFRRVIEATPSFMSTNARSMTTLQEFVDRKFRPSLVLKKPKGRRVL